MSTTVTKKQQVILHLPKPNSVLNNLEQPSRGIGFYVNANITEFMCFKQEVATTNLSGKPLILEHEPKYLGSNISSTESDVNIRIGKMY